MSNKLTKVEPKSGDLITFNDDQVGLIKRTFAKDATNDELALFLHQCKRTGLDPLAKQIYFQKRNSSDGPKVTIITGIDGYRLVADRTKQYAGSDDPIFDNEDNPRKATVTVYKIVGGIRCPFAATARWDQYYPGDKLGFMWRKMPHLMLGKCAEALALRKAFPAELSGVYTKEEMEQADKDQPQVVEAEAVPFEGPPQKLAEAPRTASIYTGTSEQQKKVEALLRAQKVPEQFWEEIHRQLMGRPSTALKGVISEVKAGL